jgi:hypothetical protein
MYVLELHSETVGTRAGLANETGEKVVSDSGSGPETRRTSRVVTPAMRPISPPAMIQPMSAGSIDVNKGSNHAACPAMSSGMSIT